MVDGVNYKQYETVDRMFHLKKTFKYRHCFKTKPFRIAIIIFLFQANSVIIQN